MINEKITKQLRTNYHICAVITLFRQMENEFNLLQDYVHLDAEHNGNGNTTSEVKQLTKQIKQMRVTMTDLEVYMQADRQNHSHTSYFSSKHAVPVYDPGKVAGFQGVASSNRSNRSNCSNRGRPNNEDPETPGFDNGPFQTPKTPPPKIFINFGGFTVSNGTTVIKKDDDGIHIVDVEGEADKGDQPRAVYSITRSKTRVRNPPPVGGSNIKPGLKKGRYHEMEVELVKWMKAQRDGGKTIDKFELIEMAKKLERSTQFKASSSWYTGFLKRCDFI